MPHVVTEPCVGVCDTACVEVCPTDAFSPAEGYSLDSDEDKEKMRAAKEQLYINPDECIDCGACVAECPVEAIFEEGDVPENWESYIDKNANRFA
jgi:NAD-dependent dihydropyrimidine dehydrogenase PreA subunit